MTRRRACPSSRSTQLHPRRPSRVISSPSSRCTRNQSWLLTCRPVPHSPTCIPFSARCMLPILAHAPPQNITSNNEDPFLWTAQGTPQAWPQSDGCRPDCKPPRSRSDGSWHIINHQQSKGNLCGRFGCCSLPPKLVHEQYVPHVVRMLAIRVAPISSRIIRTVPPSDPARTSKFTPRTQPHACQHPTTCHPRAHYRPRTQGLGPCRPSPCTDLM